MKPFSPCYNRLIRECSVLNLLPLRSAFKLATVFLHDLTDLLSEMTLVFISDVLVLQLLFLVNSSLLLLLFRFFPDQFITEWVKLHLLIDGIV